jgi:hypothetical protein
MKKREKEREEEQMEGGNSERHKTLRLVRRKIKKISALNVPSYCPLVLPVMICWREGKALRS